MVEYNIYLGTQSLNGEAIDMEHSPRLRARIKRDSHDSQSFVIAESWTAEGWKEITRRPISAVAVADYSCYGPDKESWKPVMTSDLDSLLTFARDFYAGK